MNLQSPLTGSVAAKVHHLSVISECSDTDASAALVLAYFSLCQANCIAGDAPESSACLQFWRQHCNLLLQGCPQCWHQMPMSVPARHTLSPAACCDARQVMCHVLAHLHPQSCIFPSGALGCSRDDPFSVPVDSQLLKRSYHCSHIQKADN